MSPEPRFFVARHGETVFNAAGRLQGDCAHTPLTSRGYRQADQIGQVLRSHLGARPSVALWASPTGRTLQTLAIVAERLELDWHAARTDPRLREIDIGEWSGAYHAELAERFGPVIDSETKLFSHCPPGGEWYDQVANRLRAWIVDVTGDSQDMLVITHGMSGRVMRGLLTDAPIDARCGAPLAPSLPQGSIVEISGRVEQVLYSPTE